MPIALPQYAVEFVTQVTRLKEQAFSFIGSALKVRNPIRYSTQYSESLVQSP